MNRLWSATPVAKGWGREAVSKVKLLLIGGIIGLAIGVAVTVFYFSLATFFNVQAKALEAAQKGAGSGNAVKDRRKAGGNRKAG